jgi:hypothetical protein
MSDQAAMGDIGWIYRTNEGDVGPINTAQFLFAVRDGAVVPQTLVRLSNSLKWIAASEIDGLPFVKNSSLIDDDDSPETESQLPPSASSIEMRRLFLECLDQQSSHCPPTKPIRVASFGRSLNELVYPSLTSLASYVMDFVYLILKSIFSLLVRMSHSVIVWVSVIVLLMALSIPVLTPKVSKTFMTQKEFYARLFEVFAELREFRSNDGDPDEWDEIKERSQRTLASLTPILERKANSKDSVSMSLMWIARDYLPQLLAANDGSVAGIEEKIQSHLKRIATALGKTKSKNEPWDVATQVIVGLDFLGAIAAFVYFGWRWWLRFR